MTDTIISSFPIKYIKNKQQAIKRSYNKIYVQEIPSIGAMQYQIMFVII